MTAADMAIAAAMAAARDAEALTRTDDQVPQGAPDLAPTKHNSKLVTPAPGDVAANRQVRLLGPVLDATATEQLVSAAVPSAKLSSEDEPELLHYVQPPVRGPHLPEE